MFINKKTGASYGFVAPEIGEDAGKDIKMQFPTFGSVEVRKVGDHFEADVKRTHTVVTLGEIDTLEKIDTKIDMLGKIPVIPLVAKPNENLPDGSRLTVLLDFNSNLYPQTRLEDDPVEDRKKVKLGLVALALSVSDEPDAPVFFCVIPGVSTFVGDMLNSFMGDGSEVDFHANPVPVNFTLVSGQWYPEDTIVGLASMRTTADGFRELVDRIGAAAQDNGEGNDNEGGNDDPTDNEGSGNDDPTDNEGSGNDDPTDNEGGGNDDPTDNEGGDNDDPNNGGDH